MAIIKLKTLLESLQLEAGLNLWSRTGNMVSWDYYVARNFQPDNLFYMDEDASLYDENFQEIAKLKKEEPIKILSPETINVESGKKGEYSKGRYARIKTLAPAEMTGLVKINSIRKPTTKGGGVSGGKQSKEFDPAKLGLDGKTFTSKSQLVSAIISALNSVYSNEKYDMVREYAIDCVNTISGSGTLNELHNKKYTLSKNYSSINDQDINTLSKNFGEVLAGLYTLITNKKAKSVTYASRANMPFYDYYITTEKDVKIYFSVKSRGGSSTSMANLNFFFDKFTENAKIYKMYPKEFEAIKMLVNTREYNTPMNISRFYETILSSKKPIIISKMNEISSYKLTDLSNDSLNQWFSSMIQTVDKETFVKKMNELYSLAFGDFGSPRKTTSAVLGEMYDSKDGERYDHGYLYYPMGSYIVDYLNNFSVGTNHPFVEALNTLMNYGTFVSHVDMNLYSNSIDIKISSVTKRHYKFSFNGMSKSLTNRPIGFKESSSKEEDSLDK